MVDNRYQSAAFIKAFDGILARYFNLNISSTTILFASCAIVGKVMISIAILSFLAPIHGTYAYGVPLVKEADSADHEKLYKSAIKWVYAAGIRDFVIGIPLVRISYILLGNSHGGLIRGVFQRVFNQSV